jgi:hypothetical protein
MAGLKKITCVFAIVLFLGSTGRNKRKIPPCIQLIGLLRSTLDEREASLEELKVFPKGQIFVLISVLGFGV